MQEAFGQAAAWRRLSTEPPMLSVNISGKQLHDPELGNELAALLRESGLPPSSLRLEISESVAMKNVDATRQALARLQELGIRAVIDDFGTGFSNLSSLQGFPVDTLQLDHSFVANLGRSTAAKTIAQAVIGLAHGLGLVVVAEGVETQEQLDQLRDLGCEQAQGNYFSPPLPSEELALFLGRPVISTPMTPEPSGLHV
jgi:EAL domain-containing protein (putative c-di-GMP-specific phosphodiesterase class I)